MKQHKRKFVAFKINSIIRGYTKYSSVLDAYLSIQTTRSDVNTLDINNIINQIENTTTLEDEEKVDRNNTDSESGVSEEENDCGESDKEECSDDDLDESNDILSESINTDNENDEDFEIPYWLLDSMRKGNIHSSVMDILTLRVYFCPIQVEDYTLPHSHGISLPILNVILGLLLGSDQRIKYWARNRNGRLEWFSLDSVAGTKTVKFPRLEFLNQMPLFEKRLILLETLDLRIDLDLFPKDWQLFIIAALFWLKNMNEPVVTISHLHTLVMCILDLQVISKVIGCYRKKKDFTKKYGKRLKKLNIVNKAEVETQMLKIKENKDNIVKDNGTDGNEFNMTNFIESCSNVTEVEKQGVNNIENINKSFNLKSKPTNITEILNNVTKEDCLLKFETFLPFHHLKDQLRIKPKLFCIMSVHSFAQFQSCLHHIMLLNSLLDFPLNQCFVSKFYSGIFAYNVFSEFSTKKNIDMYVRSFFKSAPSLLTLYESILNTFIGMLPNDHLAENFIKIRRKNKKGKSKKIAGGIFMNVVKEMEDEELFMDENNKFSLLAIS